MTVSYFIKRLFNMNYSSMIECIQRVSKKSKKPKLFVFLDMVWCRI